MQIVIDIPEDFYKEIKMYGAMSVIHKAVLDGIVLPKGHGRLIDADALSGQPSCIRNAQTILEAEDDRRKPRNNSKIQ